MIFIKQFQREQRRTKKGEEHFSPQVFKINKYRILYDIIPWCIKGLYPQLRLLYGIKSKAAISLTFDLHCEAIAALFFMTYMYNTDAPVDERVRQLLV